MKVKKTNEEKKEIKKFKKDKYQKINWLSAMIGHIAQH